MGTEVAISFSSLRAQLESEKSSLFKIDENIKKIVQTGGRFANDRFNASGDYSRGGPRLGGRNAFADGINNYKNDEFGKRKHETKTVFSRLSARHDSDPEDEGLGAKRVRVSSTVSRELPTRAAVLRAQGDDEQARTRNRRIFGSLLGTLQKFKQEEIGLQTKEDKKAQVERKIEEQARLQKEKEQKERKTLFAEREHKKATIKALEAKMARVQEFERWETSQKNLGNFILTKAKPHVYWIPKKMSEKASEKLETSRKYHEKCMNKKREELQEELQRIEQRCLRPRGPRENGANDKLQDNVQSRHKNSETMDDEVAEDEKGKKRDKFAIDVDDKEESDMEEKHDVEEKQIDQPDVKFKEEKVTDESQVDTTLEQNDTTLEQNDTTVDQNDISKTEENHTEADQETTEESAEPMETDNENQTVPEDNEAIENNTDHS